MSIYRIPSLPTVGSNLLPTTIHISLQHSLLTQPHSLKCACECAYAHAHTCHCEHLHDINVCVSAMYIHICVRVHVHIRTCITL